MNLSRRSAAWLACGLTLPVYLATMNRTIGFIDRGELAATAWTFGIPHATGYPTLMLVAGALAHLVPLRPVLTLNAFAALLVAASAGLLVLLFDRVLDRIGAPAGSRSPLALGAALATAFTLTWWQQANGFEVYALHTLFLPLVTLLFLRWLDRAAADDPKADRAGFAFALATGLSFTNHTTTALLAPGLLAAAMLRLGAGRRFGRRIAPLAPAFLLGLLPYAWLPIRSAMHPALDWGDTHTAAGFLRHVTGGDYRGWLFPSLGDFATQLAYVLRRLPWDFAWVGLAVAALGAPALARRAAWLLALAGLCVASGVVFAAGYRVMDVEAYLLTAVFGLALLTVAGLARVGERFGARAGLAAAGLLVALALPLHFRECDESGNRMVEQMTLDQVAALPANAVVVSALWDFGQSASLYFQHVEGLRPDVVIVNSELAQKRWYVEDLARRSRGITDRIPAETGRLLHLLGDVEAGRPYVAARVDSAYRGFLSAFVAASLRDRAVFVSGPFRWLPRGTRAVPWRVAYRVWPETAGYLPEPFEPLHLRLWTGRTDAYLAMTAWMYGNARVERARYEAEHGFESRARAARLAAAGFDPHFRLDRVGTLPLAGQQLVAESARFFERLERTPELAGGEAR